MTINVKDFGARKLIYQAVIDAGINVLVRRVRLDELVPPPGTPEAV